MVTMDKNKIESAFVHDHTAEHHAGKLKGIAGHEESPGFLATARHLYSNGGTRRFFKGLLLNWIKGPVTISISFTTFDLTKDQIEILVDRYSY